MDKTVNEQIKDSDTDSKEGAYYSSAPRVGKNNSGVLKKHLNKGLTAFLVVASNILFYFLLLRVSNLSSVLVLVIQSLQPVLYGLVIAYLLNPVVNTFDKYFLPFMYTKVKSRSRCRKISRSLGISLAIILLVVVISLLLNMLLPELYVSIKNLVRTLPGQVSDLLKKINDVKLDDSNTGAFIQKGIEEGTTVLMDWLRTDLMKRINDAMGSLTEGVFTIVSSMFNILVGLIVSVYVLYSKEKIAKQCKKAVYAFFKTEHANMILHITTKSNAIFSGFIVGKVVDSLIIGLICFVGVSLLKMPYAVLVSVIIGVTNVIPFFGPTIGAIPSALLILLADPVKGIYFILFVFLLQQFDGNILGPKILGDSTGLSAFGVITAILLGGGLFGFVGMVMGVPTLAVICYIFRMILDSRLEIKNLPTDVECYDRYSYVNAEGEYVGYNQKIEEVNKDNANTGTE